MSGGPAPKNLAYFPDTCNRPGLGFCVHSSLQEPHTLLKDLRFILRQSRKNLGFTLTAALTLALGIGAATSIFSLVNAVLLRPLPFPQPDRLMSVRPESHTGGAVAPGSMSYPDFFDWRSQNKSFSSLAAYRDARFTLTGMGDARNLEGEIVSADFFHTLGIHPELGRDFIAGDERSGQHVAMLSHQLWQSAFSSRPDIVGQTVTIDGYGYTVAGVMPRSFTFPLQNPEPQLWATLATDAFDPSGDTPMTRQRGAHMLRVVGRLRTGASVEQGRAEMSLITQ
jgi:hypothetical protein